MISTHLNPPNDIRLHRRIYTDLDMFYVHTWYIILLPGPDMLTSINSKNTVIPVYIIYIILYIISYIYNIIYIILYIIYYIYYTIIIYIYNIYVI